MSYDAKSRSYALECLKRTVKTEQVDINDKFNYSETSTVKGITYEWADDYTCKITGTPTDSSRGNILEFQYALPDFMEVGQMYWIEVKLPKYVYLNINVIRQDGTAYNLYATKSGKYPFMLPTVMRGFIIRYYVPGNAGEINGTANIRMSASPDKVIIAHDDYTLKDKILEGVTYAWTDLSSTRTFVRESAKVTGSCTGLSYDVFYTSSLDSSPLNAGETYYLNFDSTDKNIGIEMICTVPYGTASKIFFHSGYFTIPENATDIILRLRVNTYFDVDGSISNIYVTESHSSKYVPHKIISFVDDDTTSVEYCRKYYQACMHNGIPGNYAVMGIKLNDVDGLADDLLSYEEQGFGMLMHAWNQSDSAGQWRPITHNEDLAYADMCKVVRIMRRSGFVDFKHWVTPGGHMYNYIEAIGRRLGVKSIISTANRDYNTSSHFNKYFVKRVSLNPTDDTDNKSLAYVKEIIDKFVSDSSDGWIIITTHFNEWGDIPWDSTKDANGFEIGYTRFNDLVQYAKNQKCTPMQYQEAFSYFFN